MSSRSKGVHPIQRNHDLDRRIGIRQKLAQLIKIQLTITVTIEASERGDRQPQLLTTQFLITDSGTLDPGFEWINTVIFVDQPPNLLRNRLVRPHPQKGTFRGIPRTIRWHCVQPCPVAERIQFGQTDRFVIVQIQLMQGF